MNRMSNIFIGMSYAGGVLGLVFLLFSSEIKFGIAISTALWANYLKD